MMETTKNSGVNIYNSSFTGVAAGEGAEVHAKIYGGDRAAIEQDVQRLRRSFASATENEMQRRLLDEKVEAIAQSAAQKDQAGFQKHVVAAADLLAAFGKGLKGIGDALPALKAIALAAGLSLPF